MSPLTIEYVTLGAYLVFLLLLGALFSRFNRNLSDFVRGGAQGTWWLVGTSIMMSGVSAFTFTGNSSAAFEAGPTVLVIYLANCIAFAIGGLFLGAWFRQTRAYTSADLMRTRFGTAVEQVGVYIGLILNPVYSSVQLWALAVFTSAVFGFHIIPTILGLGCIVIFYSTTGGKWAVMATDFVQGVILVSITVLIAFLALVKVGGLGEFFAAFSDARMVDDFRFIKEPGQFPDNKFTWPWITAIMIMTMHGQLSLGAANRFFAVKDGREAKRASWLACILMAVGGLIWFFPPMVARILYADAILDQEVNNPADTSYVFIARELLPNGLMGVMIAAMFSATMSSMDTGLNSQAGTIARNLIPRLREAFGCSNDLKPRTELIICKLATLALGGIILTYSCLLATQDKVALFDTFLIIGSVIGIPLSFPALAGLWIKRLPGWSYFWMVGCCIVPSIISFYDAKVNGNVWTVQGRTFWILAGGIFGTFSCMPFYRFSSEIYKERIRVFFENMHTPVDYSREIGESRDYSQLIVIGNTVLAMGLAILLLLFLPNPLSGRVEIMALSAMVVSVGMLLRTGARAEKRKDLRMFAEDEESEGTES